MNDKEKRTPMQLATGTKVEINKKHVKSFGCPAYVLHCNLQLGNPHGKWDERSKMGIYLGPSPVHNKNVALIMDTDSGLVSPQFHVLFDNEFRTVSNDESIPLWKVKAGLLTQREIEISQQKMDAIPIILPGLNAKPEGGTILQKKELKRKASNESMVQDSLKKKPKVTHKPNDPDLHTVPTDNRRRSPRLNPHLQTVQELLSLQAIISNNDKDVNEIFSMQSLQGEAGDAMELWQYPMAYKASTDPDTMYMHQAMRQPDKNEFVQAMQKEVNDQMENNNFKIVHKDTVPKDKIILPTVWQMKRKNIQTQEVKKYKARLNIDGSKMVKGIHYNEIYTPVASWNSIRIMLALVAAYMGGILNKLIMS